MATYICKCGRKINKSTTAENTGNRDTAGCTGCPYLLPYGKFEYKPGGFQRDVQGHECRMSPSIDYTTTYMGQADDKCTLRIVSLDFDFLDEVQAWINAHADGNLSGGFSREDIRGTDFSNNGRYSWSIACAQNRKGMAAKAALIERFFGPDRRRLDITPKEEKAKVLADIEQGKRKNGHHAESDCPFYEQRNNDYYQGHFCHLCGSLKCKHRTCSAKYKDDWHECNVFKRYGGESRLGAMKQGVQGEKMDYIISECEDSGDSLAVKVLATTKNMENILTPLLREVERSGALMLMEDVTAIDQLRATLNRFSAEFDSAIDDREDM